MDDRDAPLASDQDEIAGGLSLSGGTPPVRRGQRLALAASLALVALGVALLPLVVRSMIAELGGESDDRLYDLITGAEVTPGDAVDPNASDYLNIAAVDLDETAGAVRLAVSGNRSCAETCPTVRLTFLSLDDNATRRRGLSPFASVTLGPTDTIYSETITLPVRGTTVRYPFDTYELWLGIATPPVDQAGDEAPPPRPPSSPFTATLQNQVPQLVMAPPVTIDPAHVEAQTGDLTLAVVQSLNFRRPEYLTVLTLVLVLLIAASSGLALVTQPINTLILGVGGLILAIWGVRSVLMPQVLPVVTAVDLALSGVILLLLLGLAARVAFHLHRQSGIRMSRRPR